MQKSTTNKNDIQSRKDIKLIFTDFYKKLANDQEMFPIFKDIIEQNHLEQHLDIITDFWEDILLHTRKYRNNPMQVHLDFIKKTPFTKQHFKNWLNHLENAIDQNFSGENSSIMKNRAQSIATVMQIKMKLYR